MPGDARVPRLVLLIYIAVQARVSGYRAFIRYNLTLTAARPGDYYDDDLLEASASAGTRISPPQIENEAVDSIHNISLRLFGTRRLESRCLGSGTLPVRRVHASQPTLLGSSDTLLFFVCAGRVARTPHTTRLICTEIGFLQETMCVFLIRRCLALFVLLLRGTRLTLLNTC
jgi:hypothetical protein